MHGKLRLRFAACALVVILSLTGPSVTAAQNAASPTPTQQETAADTQRSGRYAIALALVAVASVLSTSIAGAVVRNMQRLAPPPDDDDRR